MRWKTYFTLVTIVANLVAWHADVANAQCAVPNTLTNGQVADASQVMGNFNALTSSANSPSANTFNVLGPGGERSRFRIQAPARTTI
jgi:hypothetical protein